MAAISVQGLSKRFGDVLAVDHLSFDVDPGTVPGFLGPNGAGKTTTCGCSWAWSPSAVLSVLIAITESAQGQRPAPPLHRRPATPVLPPYPTSSDAPAPSARPRST